MEKKHLGMIPFFIPHIGCPHICIFCNQPRISGQIRPVDPQEIKKTIDEYTKAKSDDSFWEVAFYGGSFSAIPRCQQKAFLQPAWQSLQEGKIDSIRCSTRPDALDDDSIDFLYRYGVRTVELGVQSMEDNILQRAKRGHTKQDVIEAVYRLRQHGMQVGLQILPGLPGEDWKSIIATAVAISKLQPNFVRIYPVLVIEDTELADMYRNGLYTPLTIEEAVEYSAFLKTWFESHEIQVIRTGLQSTEEFDKGHSLLGGPYAPAMGELVVNKQWQLAIDGLVKEHLETFGTLARSITITYPRHITSKIRGLKRKNMIYFEETYSFVEWSWKEAKNRDWVEVKIGGYSYIFPSFMV